MAIINLLQGSSEWLSWRQSRITATDISIILGSNPWKTKLELFEEKLGLRPSQPLNAAMERGQALEPEARKLASSEIGTVFNPIVCESSKYPWLAASLDGISLGGYSILEIKCPKEFTHLEAINGNIAPYYLDQMQHQLLVTGADGCFYFSYRPEYLDQPFVIIEIEPDLEKQAEIIAKGYEFYTQLCTMSPPNEWKLNKK